MPRPPGTVLSTRDHGPERLTDSSERPSATLPQRERSVLGHVRDLALDRSEDSDAYSVPGRTTRAMRPREVGVERGEPA